VIAYLRKVFGKFRENRKNRRLRKLEPQMIYHYNHLGTVLDETRVSNSTVISFKEQLTLADHVFIGHFNFIEASNGIVIEEGVQITNYISVLTHSSHISIRLYGYDYQSDSNPAGYKKGSVRIGKFTFVGPHSTILAGTDIGKGCIISAYSMVRGTIPDFSIVAGNPAVVIGDTREMDEPFLQQHPGLRASYQKWAEK
jgi:acetyltransferase-like isoleucine patch superfamily enzyme